MDRFQGNNLDENLRLVEELHRLFVSIHTLHYAEHCIVMAAHAVTEEKGLSEILPYHCRKFEEGKFRLNARHIDLSEDDLGHINRILEANKMIGPRSYTGQPVATHVNNATNTLPPVNGTAELPFIDDSNLPHGGAKKSGFGSFSAGLEEWLRYTVVTFDS
ncbi:hypothetical protein BDV06DRAFT_226644 [Aspergillus oleicola]